MTSFCVFICAVLAGIFGGSAAASGQSERSVEPVRVRILDSVGLPDDVRTAVGREVATIWSVTGLQVDTQNGALDGTPQHPATLFVLLRSQSPLAGVATGPIHDGSRSAQLKRPATDLATAPLDGPIGLAWIPFKGNVPERVIFVSVDSVRQLLSTFSYGGRHFDRCTSRLMRTLLGRALGRVVAHEIGHFLYGAAHTRMGLMKPALDDVDLLGEQSPSVAPYMPRRRGGRRPASFRQQALPNGDREIPILRRMISSAVGCHLM